MIYSNLHTHSIFSDGTNTPEEIIVAALKLGFVSVGISDHSFTEFDPTYCMREMTQDAYIRELRRLKRKYRDRIEVAVGLEYDGFTENVDRSQYDYLIGDCHYIRTAKGYFSIDHTKDIQRNCIEKQFHGDCLAYARSYYDSYVACTVKHRPDILGHFDLPSKFGLMPEEDPAYRMPAVEAFLACLEKTPLFEVNTGAISRGYRTEPYPAAFLLREALLHGGKPVLASDAHRAEHLQAGLPEAAALLKQAGFRSQVIWKEGRFQEVPL